MDVSTVIAHFKLLSDAYTDHLGPGKFFEMGVSETTEKLRSVKDFTMIYEGALFTYSGEEAQAYEHAAVGIYVIRPVKTKDFEDQKDAQDTAKKIILDIVAAVRNFSMPFKRANDAELLFDYFDFTSLKIMETTMMYDGRMGMFFTLAPYSHNPIVYNAAKFHF